MAVISVRLNTEEEKIMEYLSEYYEEDKSTLIKHSLNEMYEDIVDKEAIEKFEKRKETKKPVFVQAQNILKDLS